MKRLFRAVLLCCVCAVLAAPPTAARADPQNLLLNPGFESPFLQQCCHTESGYAPNTPYAEVQVAAGWTGWWVQPDSSPLYPSYCNYTVAPPTCQPYHRPDYGDVSATPARIRSGGNAQQYLTLYAIHQAGLYQQVTGVIIGQTYRFSAYMEAWSNNDNGAASSGQPTMGMQVGIDPSGSTDPFSANIVWSAQFSAFDSWHLFSIDAKAKSSTITVFTRSAPQLALQHNNVYMDDAALEAVDANAPPPTEGFGVAATVPPITVKPPTPTWPPTSTPLANGEVWYKVRSGDTLAVIAYYHQTTSDEIKRLNALDSNKIVPGQKLLIGYAAPPATATDAPGPTFTPSLTPELVQLPTDTPAPVKLLPDYGQLCVVAYNDLNGSGSNDGEPGLADVRVTLQADGAPLDGYVTTGAEKSHCFPQLPPGNYTVSVAAPGGYTATTTTESSVQLEPGKAVTLVFGLALARATPIPKVNLLARAGDVVLFGGIAAMLLAVAGFAVLMLSNRKGK